MSHTGPIYDGTPAPDAPRPRFTQRSASVVRAGASLGTVIAVAVSWSKHESILLAIVHGILSWVYVLWHAVTR